LLCPSCGADTGDSSKYCPSCGTTLVRAVDEDDYIGSLVAKKYRIEELIGEGGMGKVYRARQLALDKPVVLKVLHASLLSDERTVARFQREARAASRLNHPNSISILDFGQAEGGALFIAMELVVGKDLHQILSKEWPLSEARVVRIVGQVLSALSDAHGASIIHRDLKPENIMVEQRRGEPDFVKVLDFGIAKMLDGQEDGPALTRAGFVCGTPEYMSPEQARGAQLDPRSDLYAVGVILYQLMAGLLPFDSDSAVGFATKHLTEEPLPPSRRNPDARISPAMERLIMRALSKDPNDRPESADAFRAELLGLDKERRAANGQRPLRGISSPVLQPLPRKMTDVDQSATNVMTRQPWDANEATEQALIPDLAETMPRPVPVLPRPELSVKQASLTEPEHTTKVPGDNRLLKGLTVALLLLTLGLAGVYAYSRAAGKAGSGQTLPFKPPAPPSVMPYERQVPANLRDPNGAAPLEKEGDAFHQRGELARAAEKYRAAFERDPNPGLSLKLGEVLYRSGQTDEAKQWWQRHLKDQPGSKARKYIQEMLGEVTTP